MQNLAIDVEPRAMAWAVPAPFSTIPRKLAANVCARGAYQMEGAGIVAKGTDPLVFKLHNRRFAISQRVRLMAGDSPHPVANEVRGGVQVFFDQRWNGCELDARRRKKLFPRCVRFAFDQIRDQLARYDAV